MIVSADLTLFDVPAQFDGATYEPKHDDARLSSQYARIFEIVRDGKWRTLEQIARLADAPAPSVSAQLRHMKKPRFGAHTLEKQPRGDRADGLFEYRVLIRVPVGGLR